jgi:hypothetical protein
VICLPVSANSRPPGSRSTVYGPGLIANDPDLPDRVRSLQVLRMLELLAGSSLSSEVRGVVAAKLRSILG